jgi:hypothetical protein
LGSVSGRRCVGCDRQHHPPTPVNGAIQISVAKADTAIDPGRYTDALRVIAGPNKDLFWSGQILVPANPFAVG